MSCNAVLLSTRTFDNATIIEVGNEAAGFPATLLQDPNPRAPWLVNSGSNVYFIVDLLQTGPGGSYLPIYNVASALFHNARPDDTWRVQTGVTTAGVGQYDSGVMPVWTSASGPGDYRNPLFYLPEGAHSHHVLASLDPPAPSPGEPYDHWLNFTGVAGEHVTFGVSTDFNMTLNDHWVALRIRNSGGVSSPQMILSKGVPQVSTSPIFADNGYFFGILPGGQVVAGFGDGTLDSVTVQGGSVADNDWHEILLFHSNFTDVLELWFDGALVDTANPPNLTGPATDLRWGCGSTGLEAFSGDIERGVFAKTDQVAESELVRATIDNLMASQTMETETYPDFIFGGWPVSDAQGVIVSDRSIYGHHGIITGAGISWGPPLAPPTFLQDRYMRVDFFPQFEFSDVPDHFHLGRFVLDRALQPLVIYGSGLPTPIGAPTKLVNSWDAVLTREQIESIAYAMAFDRGSSPRTLTSWGGDTFLLDGAKPIVMVNDVTAPDAWTRQQGTVYGYLDPVSPIEISAFEEFRTRITVRGM